MGKKSLLLSSLALLAVSWAVTPPRAEAIAISCANVTNVTLLPAAGCDFGGLTFSNFSVSASAGFTAATVGTGAASTATPSNVNLIYQLSSTPGVGPGDVLLSYGVTASPGIRLTGIDLTNDAITRVVIGEVACRVMFSPTGTCAPADRLATLVATTGADHERVLRQPRGFRVPAQGHRRPRRRLHQRLQQQPRYCTDPGTRHAIAARQHADGNGTGVEAPGRPPRVSTAQTGPPTSVGPFSALVWRLLRKAS